jgi:putative endonuclease
MIANVETLHFVQGTCILSAAKNLYLRTRKHRIIKENPGTRENMKTYYIYIMTNRSGTLYVGMTNDLVKRVYQHKKKMVEGFTQRYNIDRLVYFEETNDVRVAQERERQLKGWLRLKKLDLIKGMNPEWKDLSDGWYED